MYFDPEINNGNMLHPVVGGLRPLTPCYFLAQPEAFWQQQQKRARVFFSPAEAYFLAKLKNERSG